MMGMTFPDLDTPVNPKHGNTPRPATAGRGGRSKSLA